MWIVQKECFTQEIYSFLKIYLYNQETSYNPSHDTLCHFMPVFKNENHSFCEIVFYDFNRISSVLCDIVMLTTYNSDVELK